MYLKLLALLSSLLNFLKFSAVGDGGVLFKSGESGGIGDFGAAMGVVEFVVNCPLTLFTWQLLCFIFSSCKIIEIFKYQLQNESFNTPSYKQTKDLAKSNSETLFSDSKYSTVLFYCHNLPRVALIMIS